MTNAIKIWDLTIEPQQTTLHGHAKQVDHLVILPHGQLVISGSWDGQLKVWELNQSQEGILWKDIIPELAPLQC